jgi:pantoate--beta-alanine ligase
MLEKAGCSLMFTPDVAEIYPNGSERATQVVVPGLTTILCGQFRPGHFEGVATVVAKLFNIVAPDVAVFGEKDFQQLTVIRRMTADLCMPVQILGAPTVREPDGLAMSSRNQYLSAQERSIAPQLHQFLQAAVTRLRKGDRDFAEIEEEGMRSLSAATFRPDYFSVRNASDLQTPTADTRHFAVLTAARLGKARLIDNLQLQV